MIRGILGPRSQLLEVKKKNKKNKKHFVCYSNTCQDIVVSAFLWIYLSYLLNIYNHIYCPFWVFTWMECTV